MATRCVRVNWWEVVVYHTMKFMRGWGKMMAHKRRKDLQVAWQNLEEICTFIEHIYNFVLQEEVAKLEMVVRRG
jgi:hypothetical protein